MTKIEKLTPEQEVGLVEFRQRMWEQGTSCAPMDRTTAEQAITEAYAVVGRAKPHFFWMPSPMSCSLALYVLKRFADDTTRPLLNGAGLRDGLWAGLGAGLRAGLRDGLWAGLGAGLGDGLGDGLRDGLGAGLRDGLGAGAVSDSQTYWWGQMDSYWLAYYRFGTDLGVAQKTELLRRLDIMERIAASVGFWYPRDGICIVSDRFAGVSWDDTRNQVGLPTRLHNEAGPAVQFRDGWGLYYWHGVRVPAEWIEQRNTIDPTEILKAENVEQRAAGGSIIGWHRMPKTVIDGDPATDIGALVEIDIGLQEPGRFLMAVCPRNGTICEGVPRISDIDGLPIETAIAAQAWRDALPVSEYSHPLYRC